MQYYVTLRDVRETIAAVGKIEVVNITSVCVYFCLSYPTCKFPLFCVLLYHVFSSVTCLALQYFFTLSHKRYDFRRKLLNTYILCVLIFSTTFV